jgi:hypothetical protein
VHACVLVGPRGRVRRPLGGLSRRFWDRRSDVFWAGGLEQRPGAETATRQGGLVAVSGTRCVHCGPYTRARRGVSLTASATTLISRGHESTVTIVLEVTHTRRGHTLLQQLHAAVSAGKARCCLSRACKASKCCGFPIALSMLAMTAAKCEHVRRDRLCDASRRCLDVRADWFSASGRRRVDFWITACPLARSELEVS